MTQERPATTRSSKKDSPELYQKVPCKFNKSSQLTVIQPSEKAMKFKETELNQLNPANQCYNNEELSVNSKKFSLSNSYEINASTSSTDDVLNACTMETERAKHQDNQFFTDEKRAEAMGYNTRTESRQLNESSAQTPVMENLFFEGKGIFSTKRRLLRQKTYHTAKHFHKPKSICASQGHLLTLQHMEINMNDDKKSGIFKSKPKTLVKQSTAISNSATFNKKAPGKKCLEMNQVPAVKLRSH